MSAKSTPMCCGTIMTPAPKPARALTCTRCGRNIPRDRPGSASGHGIARKWIEQKIAEKQAARRANA